MSFETTLIWKSPSEWSEEEWAEFEQTMPQRLMDAITDDIYREVEEDATSSGYWEDEYGFKFNNIAYDGYGFYGFYKLRYNIEEINIDDVNENGDEVTYRIIINSPLFDEYTNFNITQSEFVDAFSDIECYEDDIPVDISKTSIVIKGIIKRKIDAIWSVYQDMVVEAKRYGLIWESILLLMGNEFREWFTNNYYDFHAAFDENGNFVNYKW